MPEPRRSVPASAREGTSWLARLDTAALLLGADGRIQDVNAAAESLMGIARPRAAGLRLRDVFPVHRGERVAGEPEAPEAPDVPAWQVVTAPDSAAAGRARLAHSRLAGGGHLVLAWPYDEADVEGDQPLRDMVDHLQHTVFRTDAQGRWTFLNGAWAKATGYGVDESLGRSLLEVVHPEDRPRERALLEPLLRGDVVEGRQTVRCLTRAGAQRWLEVSACRVVDEQGEPAGAVGALTDFSERHAVHEALLRRDAILQAVAYASERLLRGASVPGGITDALARLGEATRVSRIYVFQNHRDAQGRRVLSQRYEWTAPGVPPQIDNPELQGFSWEDAGFFRWLDVMSRGGAIHGRVRDFPENERALLEPQDIKSLLAVPIYAGDEWWGFMGFDDCVIERTWSGVEIDALRSAAGILGAALEGARAEEERRANAHRLHEIEHLRELDRFKTQFINTAAHELGTPLTPIKLQLHMMRRRPNLSDQDERALAVLERNVDRLAMLVRDVLEGARLQAGQLRVVRKRLELGAVVEDAVESFQAAARARGVELTHARPPVLSVEGDAQRLSQVLFNLIGNALKFTPRGGRIDVGVTLESGRAVVRVRDTGAGLTREQQARLFQPFSQVHEDRPHEVPGTGLGLFISRGIVEQHGGTLWVESEGAGKGATFAFALPLAS